MSRGPAPAPRMPRSTGSPGSLATSIGGAGGSSARSPSSRSSRDSLTATPLRRRYPDDMTRQNEPTTPRVDRAVEDTVASLLPSDPGEQPHLTRAVLADRLAAAATRLSRAEVMAAREHDS